MILDAFAGACVPSELTTLDFLAELRRVLRPGGVALFNITDSAPFNWARRYLAGVTQVFPKTAVSAEIPVWKGRRFGNLVVAAGVVPFQALEDRSRRAPQPYRLRYGRELQAWIGGAQPFAEGAGQASPEPPWSKRWFS